MRILLTDDHQLFREGVRDFFTRIKPDWHIDSSGTVKEARRLLEQEKYDLILCDLHFPPGSEQGEDLIEWVRGSLETIPILVLSMKNDIDTVIGIIKTGVRGYVTKGISSEQLIIAAESLLRGEIYFDQAILATLIGYVSDDMPRLSVGESELLENLTDREKEIFSLLISNASAAEISRILFISKKTVENHRTAIYKKVGVKDRMELFLLAKNNKMI